MKPTPTRGKDHTVRGIVVVIFRPDKRQQQRKKRKPLLLAKRRFSKGSPLFFIRRRIFVKTPTNTNTANRGLSQIARDSQVRTGFVMGKWVSSSVAVGASVCVRYSDSRRNLSGCCTRKSGGGKKAVLIFPFPRSTRTSHCQRRRL